jgi:CBS domain-containing protein
MNVQIPIKEIMTVNLETIQLNDKLPKAIEIFSENSFHHLPVLGQGSKLAGIVSREDVYRYAFQHKNEKSIELIDISEVMTPNPLALDIDDTIGLAADIFLSNKFHALPVTNGEELAGIITSHDLLDYAFGGNVIIT